MRGRRLACFSWAYVRTQVSRVLNELRALTSTPVREPSTVKGQEPSSLSPHQLAAQLRRLAHELEATPAVKRDQDKAGVVPSNQISPAGAAKQPKKKKQRVQGEIDMTRYMHRHIALEIMYLGHAYDGFTQQKDTPNTVEEHFFEALRRVRLIKPDEDRWTYHNYSRCGRTDKGVSAFGQVVAINLRSRALATALEPPPLEEELDYIGIINRALPDDIRIRGWCPVSEDFSARFSSDWRHYKYHFLLEEGMDLNKMQQAADLLVGEHDFRNFCRMDALQVHNYRRRVLLSRITAVPKSCGNSADTLLYVWDVRGTAFLWHQVRCMIAVLFMVAKGLEEPEIIQDLLDLEKFPRKPQYKMASEAPLVLYKCAFKEPHTLNWYRGGDLVRWKVYDHVAGLRGEAALHAGLLHLAATDTLRAAVIPEASEDAEIGDFVALSTEQPKHVPLQKRETETSYEERTSHIERKKASKAEAINKEHTHTAAVPIEEL